MASIYKRDKIWWVHYLVGGKSVCKSLKTADERVALDRKKKLEALEITGQLEKPSNIPLVTFLQSFCEYIAKTRTRKSAKNDSSYLVWYKNIQLIEIMLTLYHLILEWSRSYDNIPQ